VRLRVDGCAEMADAAFDPSVPAFDETEQMVHLGRALSVVELRLSQCPGAIQLAAPEGGYGFGSP